MSPCPAVGRLLCLHRAWRRPDTTARTPSGGRVQPRGGLRMALLEDRGDAVEDAVADRVFREQRQLVDHAGRVDQRHEVGVVREPGVRGRHVVRGDEVEAFLLDLGVSVDEHLLRLGGEAHLHEVALQPGDNVLVRHELDGQRLARALDLLIGGGRRAEVGGRGGHDQRVAAGGGLTDYGRHIGCRLDVDALDAVGRRERDGAADQCDLRAAVTGRLGDGETHLAGRAVAQEAHRVERLVRAAGADNDAAPRKVAVGAERLPHGAEDRFGLEETAEAHVPAREAALGGAGEADAPFAQQGDVRLRRRVRPHLRVHRRRDEYGRGRGERGERDHVVGHAVRESRDRGGAGGRDQHRSGGASERDVLFRGLRLRVEHIGDDGAQRQAAKGQRRHELLCGAGENDVDEGARLRELARDVSGLVARDAAADAEDDAGAVQWVFVRHLSPVVYSSRGSGEGR